LKEIVGNLATWFFSALFMQICWGILEEMDSRVETWTRQVTNPSSIAIGSPS
jgi:cytochrome b